MRKVDEEFGACRASPDVSVGAVNRDLKGVEWVLAMLRQVANVKRLRVVQDDGTSPSRDLDGYWHQKIKKEAPKEGPQMRAHPMEKRMQAGENENLQGGTYCKWTDLHMALFALQLPRGS
ncbi:hypothetical protein B0H19DRAFT_1075157 [Mycena capillaripes]|nr:hypothetical protein B0H19DRAFT_1075157 [Mycena capillaripes]